MDRAMINGYIISALGRTGSNLLCEALINTGVAGRPSESMRYWEDYSEAGLAAYIKENSTPNGVFGVKVFWSHLDKFENEIRPKKLADLWPELKYVLIRRRDKIAQAVSFSMAEQSGKWTSNLEERFLPRYQRADIERLLGEIQRQEAWWDKYFTKNAVPESHKTLVEYEDFVNDYEGTALRILDFLGIARPEAITWRRHLKRQADARSAEWIARFNEEKT